LSREPYLFPRLWLNPDVKDINSFTSKDFKLLDYKHHPAINAPIAI